MEESMKLSAVLRDGISIIPLLRRLRQLNGSASPEQLVDLSIESPVIAPQQIKSEFLELAELVKKQNCKYVLEIGTYRGGTLFVYSQLSDADATIISVDFSISFFGKLLRIAQNPFFRRLARRGQRVFLLRANSHSPETMATVQNILRGQKLDFLFIDGDHSYAGVRADFEMYSPLLRKGGLLAFHDVARRQPPEEVYKLWDETKGNYSHAEFIHRTDDGAMGIGVLWM
jgi:predicted O-methyltransferase YrrM